MLSCTAFTPSFCSCFSLPFVLSRGLLGSKSRLGCADTGFIITSFDWLYLPQLHESLPFRRPVDLSLRLFLSLLSLSFFSKGLLGCKQASLPSELSTESTSQRRVLSLFPIALALLSLSCLLEAC